MMNRTGFVTLAVLMALMALVAAAPDFVLNTPLGNQVIGNKMNITWNYPGKKTDTGDLLIVNRQSNDTVPIQKNVKLSTQKFQWTINSTPGTYYLALTSPQGIAYSGSLDVATTNSTTTTSATPSSSQPTSTDTLSPGETTSATTSRGTPTPSTGGKKASDTQSQSNASNSAAFSCSLFATLLGMGVFITQLI